MRPIIVDIAEFIGNPLRSGIQRVVRELVAHWPKDIPVVYVRYEPARNCLVRLSPRHLRNAVDYEPYYAAGLGVTQSGADPIALSADDIILVPEVFYDPQRVAFYAELIVKQRCKIGFIVFDFIPWLKPATITLGSAGSSLIMPYLMLLLRANYRCFISTTVRDDFVQRIRRGSADEAGPVLPLGADSFNLGKRTFSPDRVDLVCIGTLDGKKNQNIVFDAFEARPHGQRGRLVCLGRVPDRPATWMRRLLATSRHDVQIIDSPSEEDIAAALERARASVFVSTNEGFGLPAMESLHCGIPVVAHESLPCLADLPSAGQIRLPLVTVDTVGEAIARLANDEQARRLWTEAGALRIKTWAEYAASLAGWTLDISSDHSRMQREAIRYSSLQTDTLANRIELDNAG